MRLRAIELLALAFIFTFSGACSRDYSFSSVPRPLAREPQLAAWTATLGYADVGVLYRGAPVSLAPPEMSGDPVSRFEVVSGSLPQGLSLDSANGSVSGTLLADPRELVEVEIEASGTLGAGTAQEVSGSVRTRVSFELKDFPLTYRETDSVYRRRTPIAPNSPELLTGMVTTFRIKDGSSLPEGLSLDSATGTISGQPTQVLPRSKVTVVRTNPAGDIEAELAMVVNDLPPKFLGYSTNPATYTVNVAIPTNYPILDADQGAVVEYRLADGVVLPAGLSLSSSTGAITGNPTVLQPAPASVRIVAVNSGGSDSIDVSIRVVDPPPTSLTYSENPARYIEDIAISPNLPRQTGGPIRKYVLLGSVALPKGLTLDANSGVISGTPTATSVQADYVIEGSNSGGAVKTTVTLEVGDLADQSEENPLTVGKNRKIDMLFVVDNSGSMSDEQAALASGFARVAQKYYTREDLDICTKIITSDRYRGRSKGDYSRERIIPCTQSSMPPGLTDDEKAAYTADLINKFVTGVQVGTAGSSAEHLGKSLAASVLKQDVFAPFTSDNLAGPIDDWYRADAYQAFTVVTDENNYFKTNSGYTADANAVDIPWRQSAPIPVYVPGPTAGTPDERGGIVDILGYFMKMLKGDAAPDYAVTGFLSLTDRPNLAYNLLDWISSSKSLGYSSASADVKGGADDYEAVYAESLGRIIRRINAVKLQYPPYEPGLPGSLQNLKAYVISADGAQMTPLAYPADFTIVLPDRIELSTAVTDRLQVGEKLKVDYIRYRAPN